MHPCGRVDGFGRLCGIVPVPNHDRIPPGAELTRNVAGHDLARIGIDDLHLDVGHDLTDRAGAPVQGVIGGGLCADRRGLGHAVADPHFGKVHVRRDLLHDLHRTGGAGHHARPERLEVCRLKIGMLKLRDEHRGHAEQARAAFCLKRAQGRAGIESGFGVDDARPMGCRREIANYHSEAVIQRYRHTNSVMFGIPGTLTDEVPIVENVVVGEGGPFRKSSRPARVLDVDGIVELQTVGAAPKSVHRHALPGGDKGIPLR